MFHVDVAKVDRVMLQVFQRHVASVSKACCKRLFKMFYLFQTYVSSVLIWMLHMFHTYMSQEYVRNISTVSVLCCNKCFMLQVAIVLSGCCIFTHMLQMYVLNISSASDLCCIVLCCKCFVF